MAKKIQEQDLSQGFSLFLTIRLLAEKKQTSFKMRIVVAKLTKSY